MEHKYRWIAQDKDGSIWEYELRPEVHMPQNAFYAQGNSGSKEIERGKENPNWKESVIDLETDRYQIVDGILMNSKDIRVATTETVETISKHKLTDTELLDAIMWHRLRIGKLAGGGILVWDDGGIDVVNKKGNIRKAIKKWLRKNT